MSPILTCRIHPAPVTRDLIFLSGMGLGVLTTGSNPPSHSSPCQNSGKTIVERVAVAIPYLKPEQIAQISGLVAQYITAQREKYMLRAIDHLHNKRHARKLGSDSISFHAGTVSASIKKPPKCGGEVTEQPVVPVEDIASCRILGPRDVDRAVEHSGP